MHCVWHNSGLSLRPLVIDGFRILYYHHTLHLHITLGSPTAAVTDTKYGEQSAVTDMHRTHALPSARRSIIQGRNGRGDCV